MLCERLIRKGIMPGGIVEPEAEAVDIPFSIGRVAPSKGDTHPLSPFRDHHMDRPQMLSLYSNK